MNKNTKKLRAELRAASKAGQSSFTHQKPAPNWHDLDEPRFTPQIFPTSRANREGVVSAVARRNMCERVFVNVGENGKKASVTRHEPLNDKSFITHKNHGYLEYRQPARASA